MPRNWKRSTATGQRLPVEPAPPPPIPDERIPSGFIVAGAGNPELNGVYESADVYAGRQVYRVGNTKQMYWNGVQWRMDLTSNVQGDYTNGQDSERPPLDGWATNTGIAPAPTLTPIYD
jgi:hypothetical protein